MIIDTDQVVTIVQFGRAVGKSPQLIMYYIKSKTLPATLWGNKYYIDKAEIEKWPPTPKKMGRPVKQPTIGETDATIY